MIWIAHLTDYILVRYTALQRLLLWRSLRKRLKSERLTPVVRVPLILGALHLLKWLHQESKQIVHVLFYWARLLLFAWVIHHKRGEEIWIFAIFHYSAEWLSHLRRPTLWLRLFVLLFESLFLDLLKACTDGFVENVVGWFLLFVCFMGCAWTTSLTRSLTCLINNKNRNMLLGLSAVLWFLLCYMFWYFSLLILSFFHIQGLASFSLESLVLFACSFSKWTRESLLAITQLALKNLQSVDDLRTLLLLGLELLYFLHEFNDLFVSLLKHFL